MQISYMYMRNMYACVSPPYFKAQLKELRQTIKKTKEEEARCSPSSPTLLLACLSLSAFIHITRHQISFSRSLFLLSPTSTSYLIFLLARRKLLGNRDAYSIELTEVSSLPSPHLPHSSLYTPLSLPPPLLLPRLLFLVPPCLCFLSPSVCPFSPPFIPYFLTS
jgi:hypothetical protein